MKLRQYIDAISYFCPSIYYKMYIERAIEQQVLKYLTPGKVVLILGARRIGKTLLLKKMIEKLPNEHILKLNGEDAATVEILKQRTIENYQRLLKTILY